MKRKPTMWDDARKSVIRDDDRWLNILGAETKSRLDTQIKETLTGGVLNAVGALYWHSLLQERIRPCPTHLLLAVAQSIRDSGVLIEDVLHERNAMAPDASKHRERKAQCAAMRRGRGKSAREFREYIREQNKKLAPMVKTGDMLAKERDNRLVDLARANNPDLQDLGYAAVRSRVHRALALKR